MTITTDTIEEGPIDFGRLSIRDTPDGISLDWAEQQFVDERCFQTPSISVKLIEHVSQMAVRIALQKKSIANKLEDSEW
jgi:hypothetical protein